MRLEACQHNAAQYPAHALREQASQVATPRRAQVVDGFEAPRPRMPTRQPRAPLASRPAEERRAILLYNDECSVCRTISSWVIAKDEPKNGGKQRLDERPIGHDPDALRALHPDLDIWAAYQDVHLVTPDGQLLKGGEAIAEIFRQLPQTRWFAGLFDLNLFGARPFQALLNAGYKTLDKLRPALGCESCGSGVPWWGKPIEWSVKGWKAITGTKAPEPPQLPTGDPGV